MILDAGTEAQDRRSPCRTILGDGPRAPPTPATPSAESLAGVPLPLRLVGPISRATLAIAGSPTQSRPRPLSLVPLSAGVCTRGENTMRGAPRAAWAPDEFLDSARLPRRVRDLIKLVCEMIYQDYSDDARAERLIRRIVKKLASSGY